MSTSDLLHALRQTDEPVSDILDREYERIVNDNCEKITETYTRQHLTNVAARATALSLAYELRAEAVLDRLQGKSHD